MPEVTQLVSGGSRKREYGWSCEMTSGHMWKQAPLRALLFLFAFFFFLHFVSLPTEGVSCGGLYRPEGHLHPVGVAGCSNTTQTFVSVQRREEKAGAG